MAPPGRVPEHRLPRQAAPQQGSDHTSRRMVRQPPPALRQLLRAVPLPDRRADERWRGPAVLAFRQLFLQHPTTAFNPRLCRHSTVCYLLFRLRPKALPGAGQDVDNTPCYRRGQGGSNKVPCSRSCAQLRNVRARGWSRVRQRPSPNGLSPLGSKDARGAVMGKVLHWVLQRTLCVPEGITVYSIFFLPAVDTYRYLN